MPPIVNDNLRNKLRPLAIGNNIVTDNNAPEPTSISVRHLSTDQPSTFLCWKRTAPIVPRTLAAIGTSMMEVSCKACSMMGAKLRVVEPRHHGDEVDNHYFRANVTWLLSCIEE